jgi:hypothetical protein
MRITRETLIRLARDTVQAQVQKDRRLVCVYLTGSLLLDEPFLGGITDIDIVFVHDSEPFITREITRISEDVHLDIAHYAQSVFHQPRHLRVDPWIGPFLCHNPILLHDSHHWFEFTQASVCAQFNQPEYVFQRANSQAVLARQGWMGLHLGSVNTEPAKILAFLRALETSANAIASFSGPPLTERRLLLQFPERAKAVNRPGMAAGLADMLVNQNIEGNTWKQWQADWIAALDAVGRLENVPPRLQPCRKAYYMRAVEAFIEKEPAAAVWILLRTWTLALNVLGDEAPGIESWKAALETLALDPAHFTDRMEQLDTYIDNVEEVLEEWAHEYGFEADI